MNRFFFFTLFLLLFQVTATSRNIRGVNIESQGIPFIVFLDGEQISLPTQSCFIANLERGDHLIEAYTPDESRERVPLLVERIRYRGDLIRLRIKNGPITPPDASPTRGKPIYNRNQFSQFLRSLQRASFDNSRVKLIKTIRGTVWFTCEQVAQITEVFSFDSNRLKMLELIVPYIVDPQNYFIISDRLEFESHRKELQKLIQKHARRF